MREVTGSILVANYITTRISGDIRSVTIYIERKLFCIAYAAIDGQVQLPFTKVVDGRAGKFITLTSPTFIVSQLNCGWLYIFAIDVTAMKSKLDMRRAVKV
jgi:hypothetical protein